MKFLIKVACKFLTNQKRLIEQISVCTNSIIIKIQTTTRTWERFTKRRERWTTSLKITNKTLVPNLRFSAPGTLSTRTTISPQVACSIVRERGRT